MDHNFEYTRIVIGVSGGSASGKTTLCQTISNEMKIDKYFGVLIFSLDSFQKGILDYKGDVADFNFDDPDFIDWDLALFTLQQLIAGETVQIPTYDFTIHQRHPRDKWTQLEPRGIIFVEGIFALWDDRIRGLMNYQVYIECDADIRLCRRLIRDVRDRGRDTKGILIQYNRFVGPSHIQFVQPQSKKADLIVPGFKNNKVAIQLIVQQLKHQSHQLNLLKSVMRNELLFFGDILQNIQAIVGFQSILQEENNLSLIDDQLQRSVFFVNDHQLQRELTIFTRYLTKDRIFKVKQYTQTLKIMLKYSFQVFLNVLQIKNININDVQPININEIFDQKEQPIIKHPSIQKQYVVIIFPYLIAKNGAQILSQTIQKLQSINQNNTNKIRLIIFNLFGHIQNIMEIPKIKNTLEFVVNIFLTAMTERFYSALLNVEDHQQSQYIKSTTFISDKLFKKLLKKMNKLQK